MHVLNAIKSSVRQRFCRYVSLRPGRRPGHCDSWILGRMLYEIARHRYFISRVSKLCNTIHRQECGFPDRAHGYPFRGVFGFRFVKIITNDRYSVVWRNARYFTDREYLNISFVFFGIFFFFFFINRVFENKGQPRDYTGPSAIGQLYRIQLWTVTHVQSTGKKCVSRRRIRRKTVLGAH